MLTLLLLLMLLLLLHVTGTRGVATERQPSTRNFLRKIGDGIKDFGHDIADGAKDLGHNIEGGFKRIGHTVMATQHLQGNGGDGGGDGKEDEEEDRDPKGGPHGGQIGSGGGAEVVPSEKAIPPIVHGSARQSLIPPLRKHNSVIAHVDRSPNRVPPPRSESDDSAHYFRPSVVGSSATAPAGGLGLLRNDNLGFERGGGAGAEAVNSRAADHPQNANVGLVAGGDGVSSSTNSSPPSRGAAASVSTLQYPGLCKVPSPSGRSTSAV